LRKQDFISKGTVLSYLLKYHNISQEFVTQITENCRQELDFHYVTDTVPDVSTSFITVRENLYRNFSNSFSGSQLIIFKTTRLVFENFLRNAQNRVILSKHKLLTTVKAACYRNS
jgi:hypothetical protein